MAEGIIGTAVEEFKKAPPAGKALIGVAFIAVIGLAIYHAKHASSTAQPSNVLPVDLSTATGDVGNVPFANMPANPPVSTGNTGNTGSTSTTGPLIPFGFYNGPSYSNLKPNTYYTWGGVRYLLSTGPGGKLYGTNPKGQSVLLYGPQSMYSSSGSGGGYSQPYNPGAIGVYSVPKVRYPGTISRSF